MWTPKHRLAADRSGLRYPSDLTDAEWAIVEAMIPPARHGGRKRSVNVREVLNGIFYTLWTGCQWKALPKDLPPKSTVHDYLELWNWDGSQPVQSLEAMSGAQKYAGHSRELAR
jgi:transposase